MAELKKTTPTPALTKARLLQQNEVLDKRAPGIRIQHMNSRRRLRGFVAFFPEVFLEEEIESKEHRGAVFLGSRMALKEGASAGHRPLFLMSVLQHFRDVQVGQPAYPRINGTYVDCTFGRGGHSRALLRDLTESSTLYALDVDQKAIDVAKRLARRDPRLKVHKASFAQLGAVLGDVRVWASEVLVAS